MNVLIAVPWDQETGGVAAVVGHLGRHLHSQGHEVFYLHPAGRDGARAKVTKWGFQGYETTLRSPDSPPTLRARAAYLITYAGTILALLRICRRHRIDILNVHYPSGMFGYFAVLRRLLPRARLVVSIHGTDVLGRLSPNRAAVDRQTGRLLFAADAIVSPSAGFARECRDVLLDVSDRVSIIHNGVSLEEFPPSTRERRPDTILTIASLDPWKGLDVLIRAFAELAHSDAPLRLRIAGEGPEREALKELVTGLGLTGRVEFLGNVDRKILRDLLAECSVFVLPSRSEPFGIVVAEALAAGAPVVATGVGGIPEILDDGAYGLLVPPNDVPALAAGIREAMHNQTLRSRWMSAGPKRIAEKFRWELTGQRYQALYERLLHSGRSAG